MFRPALCPAVLALSGALLAPPALAQDDGPWEDTRERTEVEETIEEAVDETYEEEEYEEEYEEEEYEEEESASEPRESSNKGPWKPKPYFEPFVNAAIYSGSGASSSVDVGAALGAQAGIRYHQENGMLQGRTRLSGAYILTSGGTGTDVRLGSFMGVRPKLAGAEIGLDVFRNEYNGSAVALAPTTGVDFPTVRVQLGPQQAYLLGGITATWLGEESRQVDFTQLETFGFGHEFEWQAGLSLGLSRLRLMGVYYQRTVAGGTSQGLAFGLGI